MGIDPPYLYNAPVRYSAIEPYNAFDPKAISRASFVYTPPKPRPKQEGPLLNFNRHPDSYLIIPYGQTDAKPMAPQTKRRIISTRRTQLAFRILGLASAILMMISVICIKGMQDLEGWTLRVTPAVDIVFSMYGVYHLIRPAKGRTPASQFGFHSFALVLDGGLISFFVFAAILGKSQYDGAANTSGHWTSYFSDAANTEKLILASWILATSSASLHLVSLVISMYLAFMFRKITHLPPDMNPLEDNLTSRHSKHKHKTSSIVQESVGESNENSPSRTDLSGWSQADPLLSQSRRVPFSLTRNESDVSFLPQNSSSPVASRIDLPNQTYQQPRMNPVSTAGPHHYPDRSDVVSQQASTSFLSIPPVIPRKSSKRDSTASRGAQSTASRYSYVGEAAYDKSASIDDNWYFETVNDENADPRHDGRQDPRIHAITCDTPSPPPRHRVSRANVSDGFDPQPLGMNPPTPALPPDQWLARTYTSTTNTTALSSTSANKGTSKLRSYGDLKAVTHGSQGVHWDEERAKDRESRVISRTGADVTDAGQSYASLDWQESVKVKDLEEEGGVRPARYRKASGFA